MGTVATINVRLPQDLKEHGMQVLDKTGMSVSDFVRRGFEYMEREQKIPEGLYASTDEEDVLTKRRLLLRQIAGSIDASFPCDAKADYHAHLDAKYREFLA